MTISALLCIDVCQKFKLFMLLNMFSRTTKEKSHYLCIIIKEKGCVSSS